MAEQGLVGKVCLVTGASRGIGKGIALQLGEAGATVYITGRSLKSKDGKLGLEDTAHEIEARGGKCIPLECDHSDDEQIKALFQTLSDKEGKLDVLVNNAYSGVPALLETSGKPFWEISSSMWDTVNQVGLRSHYLASWHAAQLMVRAQRGLIVNVSSCGGLLSIFNSAYCIGKSGCDRMAVECGRELRKTNVAMVSLWPGPVKTETIMSTLTGDNKSTAVDEKTAEYMTKYGESIEFPGKAIVNMAKDPNIMSKSGRIFITAELGAEYGFMDVDGKRPTSLREAKTLFLFSGHPWLAAMTPSFLKLPYWILTLAGNHF